MKSPRGSGTIEEWDRPAGGLRHLKAERGKGSARLSWLGDGVVYLVLVALLTLIYAPVAMRSSDVLEIGDIASRDIKASRDLLIEDHQTTLKRRKQAAQEVSPVYDWDPGMLEPILRQLKDVVTWLESIRTSPGKSPPEVIHDTLTMRTEAEVSVRVLEALLVEEDYPRLVKSIEGWLLAHSNQRVVSGPEVLKDLRRGEYIVHSLADGSEERMTGASQVIDLGDMRRLLAESAAGRLSGMQLLLREWLLSEVQAQLRPNLVLNLTETSRRSKAAYDAVEPVFFQVRRGQMVVREGAVVTGAMQQKLEALNRSHWSDTTFFRTTGLAMVLLLFLWLARRFLLVTSIAFPRDRKTSYILGTILLVVALLSAITFAVGQGLAELFQWPVGLVVYLPHPALGSALASLTVGARVALPGGALIIGTLLSFLTALVANGGLPLFIYHLVGSLVGGYSLRTCRHRFDVLRAGVWIGLVQMMTVPVVELLAGHLPSWNWTLGVGMAFCSGLLAGLWGLALIPLLESMFDITTDSRLLELASGDHILLKQLSLRTPGTYHHSVMMGNLAEAAAENIGANPLLARVMALYHDIGKFTKPHYFVENQSGENRHDQLVPSMSKQVIMAHVKDGVELARRYKLGEPIIEAITTHHGTSLLQYFYNKALPMATSKGGTVLEADYRYPGPIPRSREAGILMLADSVEAAARTLKSPSPSQIEALVRRIVTSRIADGQLDDCRLTLREVAGIEEAFIRVLTLGFYHHRIEYPDQIKQNRASKRSGTNGVDKSRLTPLAKS
ncbi:MAG: HDIG domain-containing protein [Magnetococcales bacterium]|nr:HDIG domain-containing protein [Magnetococcales bacterium]